VDASHWTLEVAVGLATRKGPGADRRGDENANPHQRQVVYCVRAPPRSGPQATPSWPMPTSMPCRKGSFWGGVQAIHIVIAPFKRPDAPMPATARPAMSMAEDWAAPHRAEPIWKIKKNPRKDHFCH
jgi:hypothetical protein